jgi:mRNA-degrading endonuclease RelE of RelBE toxin-antitoxin system
MPPGIALPAAAPSGSAPVPAVIVWLVSWSAVASSSRQAPGVTAERFDMTIAPTARRQLAEKLPDAVAFAAHQYIVGHGWKTRRVGKRLRPPLDDQRRRRRCTYRVIYRIEAQRRGVTVVVVVHRADEAHRPQ